MSTVMQLVVFAGAPQVCAACHERRAKLAGLALAEGVVASDGANRQRVDSDFFAT